MAASELLAVAPQPAQTPLVVTNLAATRAAADGRFGAVVQQAISSSRPAEARTRSNPTEQPVASRPDGTKTSASTTSGTSGRKEDSTRSEAGIASASGANQGARIKGDAKATGDPKKAKASSDSTTASEPPQGSLSAPGLAAAQDALAQLALAQVATPPIAPTSNGASAAAPATTVGPAAAGPQGAAPVLPAAPAEPAAAQATTQTAVAKGIQTLQIVAPGALVENAPVASTTPFAKNTGVSATAPQLPPLVAQAQALQAAQNPRTLATNGSAQAPSQVAAGTATPPQLGATPATAAKPKVPANSRLPDAPSGRPDPGSGPGQAPPLVAGAGKGSTTLVEAMDGTKAGSQTTTPGPKLQELTLNDLVVKHAVSTSGQKSQDEGPAPGQGLALGGATARQPAGPAPEAPAPAPVPLRQMLIDQVQQASSTGNQSVSMTLHPESLGTIHLHVQLVDGAVNAVIKVEHPEVGRAISQQLDNLRQSFETQGIKIDKLEVNVSGDDRHGQDPSTLMNFAGGNPQQQQQADSHSAQLGYLHASDADPETPPGAVDSPGPAVGSSLSSATLDLQA